MIKIKKGTDINIRWAILTATGLNTTDFRLELTDSRMEKQVIPFEVEDYDHITTTIKGVD